MSSITLKLEIHHNIPQTEDNELPPVFINVETSEVPEDMSNEEIVDKVTADLVDNLDGAFTFITNDGDGITYTVPTKYITFATVTIV